MFFRGVHLQINKVHYCCHHFFENKKGKELSLPLNSKISLFKN
tara:strand:- start:322 stop:450 length:129 start_codon:yes stop_codon:yes gene_type:complete